MGLKSPGVEDSCFLGKNIVLLSLRKLGNLRKQIKTLSCKVKPSAALESAVQ